MFISIKNKFPAVAGAFFKKGKIFLKNTQKTVDKRTEMIIIIIVS